MALIFRLCPPQTPIRKNIGIKLASKKTKNTKTSKQANSSKRRPSKTRKSKTYCFKLLRVFIQLDRRQIGIRNVVSKIKKSEIPSTPTTMAVFKKVDQGKDVIN